MMSQPFGKRHKTATGDAREDIPMYVAVGGQVKMGLIVTRFSIVVTP